MSIIQAIISGIVQGVTEFLPVSSSGHLVLLHKLFGLPESSMFFDILLHAGTLAAVLFYFRKDIFRILKEKDLFTVSCVLLGTVPVAAAAGIYEERIAPFFSDPRKVAIMFIVVAIVLFFGQKSLEMGRARKPLPGRFGSFLIGIAQAFALLPGISRSGVTISTGLMLGFSAEKVVTFSFLLSIPAISGILCFKLFSMDPGELSAINAGSAFVGVITAFAIGMLAIPVLIKALKLQRLYIFGIYCLIIGLAGAFFF